MLGFCLGGLHPRNRLEPTLTWMLFQGGLQEVLFKKTIKIKQLELRGWLDRRYFKAKYTDV